MIYETLKIFNDTSLQNKYARYQSWNYCYYYFKNNQEVSNKNEACLQLGFYLASWGMMRGSSFLLQHNYNVHELFLDYVFSKKDFLWYYTYPKNTYLSDEYFSRLDRMLELTQKAYEDNLDFIEGKSVNVTDTLATKVLMGVYGCIPAYDRYFKEGLGAHNICKTLNEKSLTQIQSFYNNNYEEFKRSYDDYKDVFSYPQMKLVDMYFWQIGYLRDKGQIDKVLNFKNI